MKYPSRAFEELGAVDPSHGEDINACIYEVMMIKEEANFEELPLNKPTLVLNTLPYTLKFSFLDTE